MVQADAGSSVSITGTATLGADEKFTIQSSSVSFTGSVIFSSAPANTINVKRYFTAAEWHQFGVPVSGLTANDMYLSDSPEVWLNTFDEASNSWSYITDLSTGLSQNKAYMYWIDGLADQTITYTGNITASDQTPSLTTSGNSWNALSNPFTSALDWDEGTWGSNTSGTVYVWDQDFDADGEYITWNGTAGNLSGGIIPLGQGFFVEATSAGSFTIPQAARVHDSQAYYKSTNDEDSSQYVSIRLEGMTHANNVFIGFPENGTEEFDYRGDATKLFSSTESPQLFIVENGLDLSTNSNPPLTDEGRTIPLHLIQIVDGNYTITLSDLDQLPNTIITLEDLQTGSIQDLNQNPVYSFSASSNDNPQRFLLHFISSPEGIGESHELASNIKIYSYGSDICIRSTNEAINQLGQVFVYDLLGREIIVQHIARGEIILIPTNLCNTYVIVKVVKERTVITKKILLNRKE